MFGQGNLSGESLVWQMGAEGWRPYRDYAELNPPLPLADGDDGPPPFVPPISITENSGAGLAIPSIFEKKEEADVYESRISKREEESSFDLLSKEQLETLNPRVKIFVGSAGGLLLLASIILFFVWPVAKAPNYGLSQVDYNRLQDVIGQGTFEKVKMEFALTQEGDEIVVSTGRANSAQLYLTLNSIYGKILSEDQINITTSAQLRNHFAKFSVLTFESGSKLIPGYYSAKVYGKSTLLSDKVYTFLKRLSFFKNKNILSDSSSDFIYRGVVLLTATNIAKFKKSLEDFNKNILEEKTKVIKGMIESYSTLNSVLERLDFVYTELMQKIKNGREIKELESIYFSEMGPLLEGIVLQSYEGNVVSMKEGGPNRLEQKNLFDYGKAVGGLASELISETKSKKAISAYAREELLNKYKSQIESLLKRGKNELIKYENQLKEEENRFKSFPGTAR